jgi:hypothetical protein
MMDKQQLNESLRSGVCNITFIKKDGEHRAMRATKNLSLLPEDAIPKNTIVETEDSPVRVYDLEKNGWRSFKYDSLISAEYEK